MTLDGLRGLTTEGNGRLPKALPLVRMVTCKSFGEYELKNNKGMILPHSPHPNDTSSKEVFYAYYGRQANRYDGKFDSKREGTNWKEVMEGGAVVMLIDPGAVDGKIKSIYQFDSGLFKKGCYSSVLNRHPNICQKDLSHHHLKNTIIDVQRFIGRLYQTNRNYINILLQCEPVDMACYVKLSKEAKKYIGGGIYFDDRAATIEVLVCEAVCLSSLVAMVIEVKTDCDDKRLGSGGDYIDARVKRMQNDLKWIGVSNIIPCPISKEAIDHDKYNVALFEKIKKFYEAAGYYDDE